jgi:hypothetical protein
MNPPKTVFTDFLSQVGAAVDALNERKEHWLKRREEVKAKGDDAGSDDGNNGKGSTAATTSAAFCLP